VDEPGAADGRIEPRDMLAGCVMSATAGSGAVLGSPARDPRRDEANEGSQGAGQTSQALAAELRARGLRTDVQETRKVAQTPDSLQIRLPPPVAATNLAVCMGCVGRSFPR
jgi:hypothetical protein